MLKLVVLDIIWLLQYMSSKQKAKNQFLRHFIKFAKLYFLLIFCSIIPLSVLKGCHRPLPGLQTHDFNRLEMVGKNTFNDLRTTGILGNWAMKGK